ncbi:MAG TPA: TetR/AcrR family transcriptional regulator [Ktedonobacterales bacterium]|jgi:AcrR family transcriptional regulator|nr:TetR/AcrR family transcriptional regulator [Ktedonobacterales bacterium]
MDTLGAGTSTVRPLRADARQNYARLVEAAADSIGELGPNVSLEEVAKRAGVGIGTLYRHFPNRQALLEAVYRDQVNANCARGRELLATKPPAEALPLWLHSLLTYNLSMRGLKEALMAGEISPQTSECRATMHEVGGELLTRAQEAGAVRRDIEITDLLRLVHSIALMVEPGPEGAARAERVFEVMVAGMKG